MAIGSENYNSGSNNENKNGLYENTYYSRLRFKCDGNYSLNPSFRSGLLILDIAEKKEGFKYDTLISIYLSPTKARLLADEITKFKAYLTSGNIETGKAFGVNAGMNDKVTYIGFHADENLKVYVSIGKIDGSGNIIECHEVSFQNDYHFSLEWDNIKTMDVAKAYHNNVELDQIHEMLIDFGRSMNGVIAYSMADLTRYDSARVLKKMDPIYDKLGIERRTYSGNNGGSGNNNFLNNSRTVSSNHTDFDSVEDLLGE